MGLLSQIGRRGVHARVVNYRYDIFFGNGGSIDNFIMQVQAPTLLEAIKKVCAGNPKYYCDKDGKYFVVEGDHRVYGRPTK